MTSDMVFTLAASAADAARQGAVDLAEIRRTDATVELLASRRLSRPSAIADPVVNLLGALAEDVDADGAAGGAAADAQTGGRPAAVPSGSAASGSARQPELGRPRRAAARARPAAARGAVRPARTARPVVRPGWAAACPPARSGPAGRTRPAEQAWRSGPPGAADWARTVAAIAVIATVAGTATTTGIAVTGLLLRLTGAPLPGAARRTWR